MRQGPGRAASKVEHEELEVAERVLDVVAEHPQEQHVSDQVKDVEMEEHVGEERHPLWNGETVQRPEGGAADVLDGDQLVGNDSEARDRVMVHAPDLDQEQRDVHGDEQEGHILKRDRFERVVIVDRQEH